MCDYVQMGFRIVVTKTSTDSGFFPFEQGHNETQNRSYKKTFQRPSGKFRKNLSNLCYFEYKKVNISLAAFAATEFNESRVRTRRFNDVSGANSVSIFRACW